MHSALLATAVACAGWRLRLSERFCAATRQRYGEAAWLLGLLAAAAALVINEVAASAAVTWQPDGAAAFAALNFGLHAIFSFALPLLLVHRHEHRERRAYALRHGLAAEAAALQACRWWRPAWLECAPAATPVAC